MLLGPFEISPLAPCSFQLFAPCSFLTFLPDPFSFFLAPYSFLSFLLAPGFFLAPCSFFSFFSAPCSLLAFFVLFAPARITICLLPSLFWGLLLVPFCQIGHAPCSGIIPNRGSFVSFDNFCRKNFQYVLKIGISELCLHDHVSFTEELCQDGLLVSYSGCRQIQEERRLVSIREKVEMECNVSGISFNLMYIWHCYFFA